MDDAFIVAFTVASRILLGAKVDVQGNECERWWKGLA
jgi:hypothetical protein